MKRNDMAVNGERLEEIRWRNFERLVAEFFKPKGYVVQLGPGTKDGGIDLRIWPSESEKKGPPLLLIQCKRLQSKGRVKVEYVKAFWTDVQSERAGGGLIATTASVARSGKRVREARKWPMKFAEAKAVQQWARSMWRYSGRQKRKTVGVGRYLLPPVVP